MKLKTVLAVCALALSMHATASASDISSWALNDYIEANSTGLLSPAVVSNDLGSNITREEFCELIINLYEKLTNEELRVPEKSPFVDCQNPVVSQAYYNGIVSGVSEDRFEPNSPITRQTMAVMLVNMLNASESNITYNAGDEDRIINSFADHADVSDWTRTALATLVNYNLISGNEYNQILPLANTTREQAIACINRCYKVFAQNKAQGYILPTVLTPVSSQTIQGDLAVSWTGVSGVQEYSVIVKNSRGEVVAFDKTVANVTSYTVNKSKFATGDYSVTIGALMQSGDTVFGIPADFSYGMAYQTAALVNYDRIYNEMQQSTPQMVAPQPQPQQSTVVTPVMPNIPVVPPVPFTPQTPQPTPAPQTPVVSETSQKAGSPNEVKSAKATEVLNEASKYLGVKYVYGGSTPDGFDCSGFVQYVFKKCGINLKRVSKEQYSSNGVSVAKSQLQPGDLVFFGSGGVVSHVGIYAGNGEMIHSPSTGKTICYTSINSNYYLEHYIGAKRVLN